MITVVSSDGTDCQLIHNGTNLDLFASLDPPPNFLGTRTTVVLELIVDLSVRIGHQALLYLLPALLRFVRKHRKSAPVEILLPNILPSDNRRN